MVINEGTPVREIGDVLRALLDGTSDVANERGFGIIWLQSTDIIIQTAKTFFPAVLTDIVAANPCRVTDCFVQISSLLDVEEGSDSFHELDGALFCDFVVLELDLAEISFVHFVQDGHKAIVADVLLYLEVASMIQGIVLKHPAVDIVFDDFHLIAAETFVVLFPDKQLVEL